MESHSGVVVCEFYKIAVTQAKLLSQQVRSVECGRGAGEFRDNLRRMNFQILWIKCVCFRLRKTRRPLQFWLPNEMKYSTAIHIGVLPKYKSCCCTLYVRMLRCNWFRAVVTAVQLSFNGKTWRQLIIRWRGKQHRTHTPLCCVVPLPCISAEFLRGELRRHRRHFILFATQQQCTPINFTAAIELAKFN